MSQSIKPSDEIMRCLGQELTIRLRARDYEDSELGTAATLIDYFNARAEELAELDPVESTTMTRFATELNSAYNFQTLK